MQRTDNNTNARSVLALLRGLVPQRQLTFNEALRIAELQANHLLEHFSIDTAAVPDEIVSELPRIKIERERSLPVSGSAHWNGRYWVITICADEHRSRQRFSLMHEFKHVLDHTTKDFLYQDRPTSSAYEQAERVADYFAACLLMPKRVVKRLWFEGPQSVERLAEKLRVSPAAARYRLDQLGLTDRPARCETARHAYTSRTATRSMLRHPALTGGTR
jgi:Zn-dependent peptidase ImmA (M78 family)